MKAFIFALLFLLSTIPCQSQTSSSPQLRVTIQSEQHSVSLRDEVHLMVMRENSGEGPLIVPRQWGWGTGRTEIHVFDSQGKEVQTEFLADELPPPPQPYDFIVLDPGEFVGTRLHEPVTQFVKTPGEYEFVVVYTSYLSDKYARQTMKMPNAPFWARDRGAVTSNKIKIRVTD
jgi:hypothetical protein